MEKEKSEEERLDQIGRSVHQQMVIADSPSGGEPLPLLPEKTLKQKHDFIEAWITHFGDSTCP